MNADSKSGILDAHNTLTLQNITLKNGKWLSNHSGGAGVYVNSGGTLIMKGSSIIENCSADNSGGGVYVSGGTFEMHDTSKITGCSANKEGGGVYVQQGGTFKMHNSSAIISCSANKGGAIFVNGATVNITNCTLKGNEAVSDGGAIYAQKEGSTASTVTISGGTIGGTGTDEKNKVTGKWHFGGGIFVDNDCTLTLDSVRIIGNEAWRAGGVRANRSTVTMTDCTIKNNKTTGDDDSNGGGVYTFMGRLTMTGCTITGNKADTNGGGLNVEGTTTNITNCTFTGNTAKNGGGIYTKKIESTPATVTISGGTIGGTSTDEANKATGTDGNGGGIYVGENCKVTLQNNGSTGCTITGNTAAKHGGGVYVNGKTFTMSGNAKIEADNDVYLESEKTITVDGTLSNNPAARITPREYKENVPVLRGGSGVTLADEVGKFTVTSDVKDDGIAQAWIIDTTGKLEKSNMEVRYDKLASYLSPSPHAVEEGGVYRFKITGTIPSNHLQSAGYNQMGRLAQTIHNSNKKVALILPDSIPDLTSMNEGFYGCEYLVSLENIPSGVTDMEGCFKGCTKLTHAPAIPSGVTTMRECFKGCTDLRRASNIPSTVGNMNKCFEDCKNLTVAPQIESGVTNMERSFAGCKALTQGPDIPSSVSMMYQCFDGCKSLKGVKLMCNYDDSVSLFQDVFKNCTALEDGGIKVPQNQLQEYKNHAGKMGVTDPDKFVGF
ncbi:leucine-rich repeat protein [Treponema sp. OMZ 803]|uniref:right-handed parallel beta-helix repeat-containing protein n=1 Tax=Treponema sp. OMZ 803 TaxID=120682 RepID=UPI0020A4A45D|nr:right-handed parallel beta-helix repeat-containing protein [Treponema sp. OMZ 803]UTC53907.1 leucine-rich repeat protein [Treponema sp. OMZ 803]